ncbi:MAG: tail fiber protein [Caulobacteraceae bacterium]|nr:tail fiber protein [Caulobacteraceae bacterium]
MSTPYVGEIRMFGFPRIPTGWLACDGSLQSISNYEVLYTLIGTTYGGNGTTNFGLPDLRGQTPLHNGTGPGLTTRVIGQNGGSERVALNTASTPGHSHSLIASQGAATASVPTGALFGAPTKDTIYMSAIGTATKHAMNTQSVSPMGGGLPHDNTMPTLTVSACIAWAGIFPSRS